MIVMYVAFLVFDLSFCAIISYLEYKQEYNAQDLRKKEKDAALNLFRQERRQNAPSIQTLEVLNREEAEYFAAISDFPVT